MHLNDDFSRYLVVTINVDSLFYSFFQELSWEFQWTPPPSFVWEQNLKFWDSNLSLQLLKILSTNCL